MFGGSKRNSALGDIKVLDLAGPVGLYCTKLLADLGANVIKIEPPGGHPARRIGPFYRNEPHLEKSLYWFHMNTNKQSITLNLDHREGREILKTLVAEADIMVETTPTGHLEKIGLGYAVLNRINPRIILTSVTPFGQTGPWREYKASDIVGAATGGLLSICGWPELPPMRLAASPAYHQASLQAAVGSLLALASRDTTGEGQHVDVSMQQSVPLCLLVSAPHYFGTGEVRKRTGDEHRSPVHGVFPCSDGYVDFRTRDKDWDILTKWLDSEGMAGDLKGEQWKDPLKRRRRESIRHIDGIFRDFLQKKSKIDIYEEGQARGLEAGAVYTAEEVSKDKQLAARGFFVPLEHEELGQSLTYIGAPFRLSETPWQLDRRAPLIGEHNREVYQRGLGFSVEKLISLKMAGVI